MQCIYLARWRSTLALPLLLAIFLIAGCGSSADSSGAEAYEEVLHGLQKAALANRAYGAVSRADGLKPTLRASLDAFCETNREMLGNQEAWKASKLGYYVVRIKIRAERELPFVSTAPVNVAVNKYKGLFDLASFDPAAVRRYAKACYG
jgi:hypothetical protein